MTRLLPLSADLTPARAVWMLLGLSTLALWPTLVALAHIWRDMFDYHHGVLIAAISVLWLVRSRQQVEACGLRPMRIALPLLALAVAVWAVAYRANSELMQQVLVPIIPLLSILAVAGPQVGRHLAGPLAYLYFAIPIWEQLLPMLQWLTTLVAQTLLGMLGVPIEVEGNHVTIPSGQFSIVEGCSGKRYLIIALAFAVLVGVIERLRWRKTLLLLGCATALALIANWLRVVVVVYAGHVTQMQHYLVATEHKSFGYALFVPLLLAILWIARRMGRTERDRGTVAVASEAPFPRRRRSAWLLAVIVTSLPVFLWARTPAGDALPASLGLLPVATGAWQGPLPADLSWKPRFVGSAEERRAAYLIGGNRIEIYVNVYGAQSQGRELVFYRNSVTPADRWSLIKRLPEETAGPHAVIVADPSDARWVVAHIYRVGGHLTASSSLAQLYYGLHAVLRPVPAGALAMAAPCLNDCTSAARSVKTFWREHGEQMAGIIPDRL